MREFGVGRERRGILKEKRKLVKPFRVTSGDSFRLKDSDRENPSTCNQLTGRSQEPFVPCTTCSTPMTFGGGARLPGGRRRAA